jgi:hypothetical protein
MGKPSVGENLTRRAVVVVMNQNAAGNHPDRAFENAHVLIQHQMTDIGAVQQSPDRGNQHHIVGPNQFTHLRFLPDSPCFTVKRLLPLPRHPALSIVCHKVNTNCGEWKCCLQRKFALTY